MDSPSKTTGPDGPPATLKGRITLFGFPPTDGVVQARPRSLAWRGGWAFAYGTGGVALATLAALVPPHAPWVAGALGLGTFLALRRWRERYTLLALEGSCPRCGLGLTLPSGTPIRGVMSVSCDGCRHDSTLTVFLPD